MRISRSIGSADANPLMPISRSTDADQQMLIRRIC